MKLGTGSCRLSKSRIRGEFLLWRGGVARGVGWCDGCHCLQCDESNPNPNAAATLNNTSSAAASTV